MKRLPLNSSFQRVLVCLVLVLIIFNGIFVTISPEFSLTSLLKYIVSRAPDSHKSACPKMSIKPADSTKIVQENTACLPHIQSEKACEYTANAYAPYPSLLECPEIPYELCTILEKKPASSNHSFTSLKVRCDMSLCDPSKPMYVEAMNPKNGEMIKYNIPMGANDSTVENLVLKYVEISRVTDLHFLFLNCTGLFTNVKISQLLTFLPALPRMTDKARKHKVNVNVVVIDSLSRAHFYRSLPNTVKFLQKINADPSFPGYIFEYELFQAVHGHTHESEQALFSGSLYPETWTSKEKSAKPVDLHMLYGVFKEAGYQTMFLDDLCWTAIYGIVTSLRAWSWTTLLTKMKGTNIDTRGLTEAACKILMDKGKHTLPFFDNKEHQLCFNGKHQHEYLFDYLIHYIDTIKKTPERKPLFSYTATHVSHDEIGLRVQSVDKHLREFIEMLSTRNNTISFIFADHGNTYTGYQSKFLEGKQEMYHPMMLVVLPKILARKFGNDVVRNLQTNQQRLFDIFHLRKSLIALAKYDGKSGLERAGLFGYISKDRTCRDVTLTENAICICRARTYTKLDKAEEFILSEFAIGELNNKIQGALLKTRGAMKNSKFSNSSSVLFGSCQRLRIQKVRNIVQESKSDGLVVTSMDISVQSGTIVDQEELITVQVESAVETDQSSLKMKLLSFNRVSKYGPHKECADQDVPLKLCICNKKSAMSEPSSLQEIVGISSNLSPHSISSCIVQIRREISGDNIPKAGAYEIANICGVRVVNVTITSTNNIRTSTYLPIFLSLPPRTIYFVCSLKAIEDNKLDLTLDIRRPKNV